MTSATGRFAIGTFSIAGGVPFAGVVVDEKVIGIRALSPLAASAGHALRADATTLDMFQLWDKALPALEAAVAALPGSAALANAVPMESLTIHPPVQPRQILCSGANYRKHVIDLIVDHAAGAKAEWSKEERRAHAERLMDHRAANGRPFVFSGLASAMIGARDTLVLPYDVKEPDWELELALVIGKPARRVARKDAFNYVAGYLIANDVTARELLDRPDVPAMGMDWVSGKWAPNFLPLGPYIVPAKFVPDPQNLQIQLKLNGQMMQDESTADMIFPVDRLIEYISHQVQLLPGDVILTGSPAGNGTHYGRFLKDGDVMDCEITGLGRQRTACVLEKAEGPIVEQAPLKAFAG